jgi:hypothetical protein
LQFGRKFILIFQRCLSCCCHQNSFADWHRFSAIQCLLEAAETGDRAAVDRAKLCQG